MEDIKKALSSLAIVAAVLFAVGGFDTNWSFSTDRMYLPIACADGLDANKRCASGNWQPDGNIYIHIIKESQKILMYSDASRKTEKGVTLSNCTIYNDDDWQCAPDDAGSVEGVSHGRFYANLRENFLGTANLDNGDYSSIGGWNYFLYRVHLSSLGQAMIDEGFTLKPTSTDDNGPDSAPPVSQSSSSSSSSDGSADLMQETFAPENASSSSAN